MTRRYDNPPKDLQPSLSIIIVGAFTMSPAAQKESDRNLARYSVHVMGCNEPIQALDRRQKPPA